METETKLSPKKLLSLALSMKYLTNATILASVISYYSQAYWIFLVSISLLISNAIVIILLEWFNGDELIAAVLDIPITHTNELQDVKLKFMFINTIWHFVPLLWVWYIISRDDVIKVFQPNFMGIFLASAAFGIGYFYFASQGEYYGKIDYLWYMMVYIIVLLAVCVVVYRL